MTERRFDEPTLDQLRNEEEIVVETHADGAVHRIIIWVVVDDAGRVLIRSVRGASARWYREAVREGSGTLIVDGTVIPARFERATDAERIEACSRALPAKYGLGQSTQAMLRDEVLDTTLEVLPA